MKHYMQISRTDASAVVRHRKTEIEEALTKLTSRVSHMTMEPLTGQKPFDWGDVGTLSHILKQLEELNSSLGE